MPALSAGALARRLRALSARERLAFLAAVWDARGYDTRVDSEAGVVRASRDRERQELRVAPVGGGAAVAAALGIDRHVPRADIYVGLRESDRLRRLATARGSQFEGPARLRDFLLYGLDRSQADRLARDHLGGPLTVPARPIPNRRTPVLATIGIVLAAALLLAATAGAGAGAGLPGLAGPGDASAESADDGTPTLNDSADIDDVDPNDALHGDTDRDGDGETAGGEKWNLTGYPPGLSGDGVEDADALLAAHYRSSEAISRELRVTYTGPANTTLLSDVTRHEGVARIHDRAEYRLTVSETEVSPDPNRTAGNTTDTVERTLDVYGAGRLVYTRVEVGNEAEYSRLRATEGRSAAGYEGFAGEVMRRALRGGNTTVTTAVGLQTRYRITVREPPPDAFPRAQRFRATADVTPDGRIARFELSYVDGPTGEEVLLRVAYDDYGVVEPPDEPDWLDRVGRGPDAADRTG